jgi:hypothetical protein
MISRIGDSCPLKTETLKDQEPKEPGPSRYCQVVSGYIV